MMKHLLLMLCFLASLTATGQSRMSVDLLTGIDFSYRLIYTGNLKISSVPIRNKQEIAGPGVRGGLNVNIRLSHKLLLKSGVRYLSCGYNTRNFTGLKYDSEYDPVSGTYNKDESLPHEIQFRYRYRFIEVPLGLRYVFIDKKIDVFTELGFTANFFINNRSIKRTDIGTSSTVGRSVNIAELMMGAYCSVGLQHDLNENMQFFVQPIFRYGLTPVYPLAEREHLYSAGAELGLRYFIRKNN